MIGRPRQGDMLVRSASAETIKRAPTVDARSRIRLSSRSGQSATVCGGSVVPPLGLRIYAADGGAARQDY